MFQELPTDWLVIHGLLYPEEQVLCGYTLVNSCYRIATMRGQHALRVYRKLPGQNGPVKAVVALEQTFVHTDGSFPCAAGLTIEGAHLTFDNPLPRNPDHLLVCLLKDQEPIRVTASVCAPDGTALRKQIFRLAPVDPQDPVHGFTQECRVATTANQRVNHILLTAESERTGHPVRVTAIEPVLLFDSTPTG